MTLRTSTQFRRAGQRDGRRRRLLADESTGSVDKRRLRSAFRIASTGSEVRAARKSQNYGDADFMEESRRLIDLVPRRLSTFGFWLIVALTVIAGLEALYAWMPDLAPMTTDGRVAAFDLDGEGSLAVWFSSLVLLLASVTAVLVFAVRRYKTDDYQGHYRVWLWAALCWLVMSIDETASLHEGFKEMMAYLTGTRLLGDGSAWWVLAYGFVLGAVGSRLLVDMRRCRLSAGTLMLAAACYLAAVVTQLGWILPESGARGVMLEEGAEMLGNVLLLLAMGLHARYVILDAEGLLPRREPRAEEPFEEDDPAEESLAEVDDWVKVDSAHRSPQPVLKRKRKAVSPVFESEPQSELAAAETSVRRKLTKGQRKALRKRLMQQRLEREREQKAKWS